MTDEAFPWFTDAWAGKRPECLPRETRFARPWTVEDAGESFVICDANRRPLGYFYFCDELARLHPENFLTRNGAWRTATSLAAAANSAAADQKLHEGGIAVAA